MGWKDNLESSFINWSKRSSNNEEQQCENALNMIKDAIKRDEKIKNSNIEFIPQGSYHNNTNVRLNSDVDICVRLKTTFFYNLPNGMAKDNFGIYDSAYTFSEYQADIERALVNKFGRENVKKGNKAFDIKSNTYRVSADAVACFEHRRYKEDGTYIIGTQFTSSTGETIVNFPEQHYSNGVIKNTNTSRRFKRIVRILKRLKYQMESDGLQGLQNISSFLIECLVWNVPNENFNSSTYSQDVKNVLLWLYNNTNDDSTCKEWGEVSDLLYLFHSGRKYTRVDVNNFIVKAYNHVFV